MTKGEEFEKRTDDEKRERDEATADRSPTQLGSSILAACICLLATSPSLCLKTYLYAAPEVGLGGGGLLRLLCLRALREQRAEVAHQLARLEPLHACKNVADEVVEEIPKELRFITINAARGCRKECQVFTASSTSTTITTISTIIHKPQEPIKVHSAPLYN